jgi:hypothetical protein
MSGGGIDEAESGAADSTARGSGRRSGSRRVIGGVLLVLVGLVCGALFGPVAGGAWPWDDERDIRVHGDVTCMNIDVGSKWGFGNVEWMTIRGRDDPVTGGTPALGAWETYVPPGWTIEWTVKCSGASEPFNGEIPISKTAVGSSYDQTRHICVGDPNALGLCVDDRFGGCVKLLVTGVVSPPGSFESNLQLALKLWGYSGGPSDHQECLRALRDALPALHTEEPPPPDTPASTIPPQDTLPTIPTSTTPPTTGGDTPSTSSGPGPTQGTTPSTPPPPNERPVTVDNRVTNGVGMREDTPAYLSSVTQNYCKRDGCALAGTDMSSGARITAICQTAGVRTTNGHDGNVSDDTNPELYSSTRWYGIRWSDGRFGYLSEVWLKAADRGGLGLPNC